MKAVTKSRLILAVRALLSLVLIFAIVWHVGSTDILREFATLRWSILVVVTLVLASHVLFITPRWQAILEALGYSLHSRLLVGSVFLGFLFNQLLPTAVGGDVLRAWRAHKLGVPVATTIHSLVIDRASGVLVVIGAVLVLLPFANPYALQSGLVWIVGFPSFGVVALCCILWLLTRMPSMPIVILARLQGALVGLVNDFVKVLRSSQVIAIALLSIIGQAIPIIAIVLIARELQVSLSLIDFAVATCGAMLAAAIPVSIAGWGVREGALILLLGLYGVEAHTALVISLVFGSCLALASAPGALLLFIERPQPAAHGQ